MNRQDRREAMGRGCVAPYRLDGQPVHAPADCDGTCHQDVIVLDGAFGISAAALAVGIPAEEVARVLVLVLRQEVAAARAEMLAALVNAWRLAWDRAQRLGGLLARRGPRRLRRRGPADVVLCCPPTGPPAGQVRGAFAWEVPVT
jgi:hypothetical protein